MDARRFRIGTRSTGTRAAGGSGTSRAGSGLDVAAWGNGVCAGDYDNDGRLDLYVTNFGPNFLFRNNGDGTFSENAVSGRRAAAGWSTGCTFFDADADGDLDLYVARYVARAGRTRQGAADADLARGAEDDGRPEGHARRGRPLLREPRGRDDSSRPPTPRDSPTPPVPTVSAWSQPTMTPTAGSISTSPTTPLPISCTATAATDGSRASASPAASR